MLKREQKHYYYNNALQRNNSNLLHCFIPTLMQILLRLTFAAGQQREQTT